MSVTTNQLFQFLDGSEVTGEATYDMWRRLVNPEGTAEEFLEYMKNGPVGPTGPAGPLGGHLETTTDTTISDSKSGGLRFNEIGGASEQDGTPTPDSLIAIENAFDCVEMMQGLWSTSTGAFTPSSTEVCSKRGVSCKPNDIIKIDLETSRFIRVIFYKGDTFVSSATSEDVRVNTYSTTVSSGVDNFKYYIGETKAITPQTVGKIELTINDKYVGQIVEWGKNFFTDKWFNRPSALVGDYYATTEPVLPSGDYMWTGVSFNSTVTRLAVRLVNEARTSIYNLVVGGGIKQNVAISSNESLYLEINYTFSGFVSSSTLVGQLEQGTVATDYEPYTEKVATFFLNEPLRETDVMDRAEVVRKRKKWVFDGTESWDAGFSSATNEYAFSLSTSFGAGRPNGYYTGIGLCNYFAWNIKAGTDVPNTVRFSSYSGDFIWFYPIGFETVDVWKTWLAEKYASGNPVTIEYELAEEVIETLDTDSQIALNSLETFDGATNIVFDSTVKPTFEVEYGTSQVGAYTLKALLNSENNTIRYNELATALVALGSEV